MKVVTWNVHGFVGARGRVAIDGVAEVLLQLSPDIVGLQEVVDRRFGPEGRPALEALAQRLGMTCFAGPTRRDDAGAFGNALLTSLDVIDARAFDVSMAEREARGVIEATLRSHGGELRVFVTHFGLRAAERRRQVDLLLARLVSLDPQAPALVLGDFNEWHTRAYALRRLHRAMGSAPSVRSFPARFPLLRLDRIWARPRVMLRSLAAARVRGVARVSDHLPVVATIDLHNTPAVECHSRRDDPG
jgi:endonuclease/exonuclease/phosphatase family metal-dependent hydrolase